MFKCNKISILIFHKVTCSQLVFPVTTSTMLLIEMLLCPYSISYNSPLVDLCRGRNNVRFEQFAMWFLPPLCRPVPLGHYGLPAGLSEEGEGEDGRFPGSGAAGRRCQDRNPAVPHEDPRDHQGRPSAQGLCTQVSDLIHGMKAPAACGLCTLSIVNIHMKSHQSC